jgi:5-methylcytosine-specific restriction endonuclease McrA
MASRRWSKFWWQDWSGDKVLHTCSLAARGAWMELLCIMHEAEPFGHLLLNGKPPTTKQLANLLGAPEKEVSKLIAELADSGVFSRTPAGVIYSRRFLRDQALSEDMKEIASLGGNPSIIRGTVPKEERNRGFKRTDSPRKTERIFAKSAGKCHWCGIDLQRETAGPDFFHVDHVIAVRDGGTNDEANLVAACSACNHNRARHQQPTPTPTDSDPNPDPNHLEAEARRKKLEAESKQSTRAQAPASDFDAFWDQYPRKVGKDAARKAYNSAIRRASPEQIRSALICQIWPENRQFIPHPVTWLNQGRWQDDPAAAASEPQKSSSRSKFDGYERVFSELSGQRREPSDDGPAIDHAAEEIRH